MSFTWFKRVQVRIKQTSALSSFSAFHAVSRSACGVQKRPLLLFNLLSVRGAAVLSTALITHKLLILQSSLHLTRNGTPSLAQLQIISSHCFFSLLCLVWGISVAPYRSRIKKVLFPVSFPPFSAFLSVCVSWKSTGGKKEGQCSDSANTPSETPIPNHPVRFRKCCEIIRGHEEGARFSVV